LQSFKVFRTISNLSKFYERSQSFHDNLIIIKLLNILKPFKILSKLSKYLTSTQNISKPSKNHQNFPKLSDLPLKATKTSQKLDHLEKVPCHSFFCGDKPYSALCRPNIRQSSLSSQLFSSLFSCSTLT
jgi:hypothetical protein